MNTKEIKELVDLVALHGLAGLEVERAGFRLRIEGPRPDFASMPARSAGLLEARVSEAGPPEMPTLSAASRPEIAVPAAEPRLPTASDERIHVITSPIVGTFYRSPNPDTDPFVKIGDVVEKGATLCIIEAMKLMNEIEAEVAGTIVAVHPQNSQPVEYGEKLFTLQLR